MLDKLVESKNSGKENKRLSGFLATTFMTVAAVLSFGLIYSLFSQTLTIGSGDLNVASLIAPVAFEPETPPLPEPDNKPQPTEKVEDKLTSRVVNMERLDESPDIPPDVVSVTQNKYQARPNSPFVLNKVDSNPVQAASAVSRNDGSGNTNTLSETIKQPEISEKIATEKPPVIKQPEKPVIEKPKLPISTGVVNGKAINLVKPVYSSAARTMRVGGEVRVQVTIDEDGKVISANAVSGSPLLRDSAEAAAKSSKFTPTFLSNQKVKVTGIIIYNFAVQ